MNTIEIAKTLGAEVLQETTPTRIPVKINHDRFVNDAGNTMAHLTAATPGEALRSSLIILFKHIADVHITVVDIIAEKYKLNQDEILSSIKNHPKWLAIFNDPIVHDLTEDLRVDIPFDKTRQMMEKERKAAAKKPRMAGKKRSADAAMEDVTQKMATASISSAPVVPGVFPPLPLPDTAVAMAQPSVPSIPTFPDAATVSAAAAVPKKVKKFKKPVKVSMDETN